MTRVLDRDALDAAAGRMLGGTRVDLAAVHAAARRRARARRRRAWVASATVAGAVAATVVLLAGGAVPGVALPMPAAPAEPATPTGPGEVPDVVRVPPPWTPSATERPLSRVAYAVLDTRGQVEGPQRARKQVVWLVGADRGEYRSLPAAEPHRLAVSADGSRVAWVEPPPTTGDWQGQQADLVKILDVREGVVRQVRLPGTAGRGFAVEGTAFAPAGNRLALWGADRGNGGRLTPRLLAIDAAAAEPATTELCACVAAPAEIGFALTDDGRYVTGRLAGGAWVPRPPPVNDPDEPEVGLPATPYDGQLLVSPDGRTRYEIVGAQLTGAQDRGRETFRYSLRAWPETSQVPVPVADLGVGTAVLPLGTTEAGTLVSRWSTEQVVETQGSGPGAVLLVRAGGVVEQLSASEGRARVIGVATAVATGGTVVPAAEAGSRATSATWYAWQVRRRVGGAWAGVSALPFWLLAPAGAAVLVVALRVLRRRPVGRRALGAVAVPAAVVVLVAGAVTVAGELLDGPSAPAVSLPSAEPVVPAVLRDQHRVPPRAFDGLGSPGTTRVALLVSGEIAGRQGVYGTDAATGRMVRLDDLPGLDPGEPGAWTVSPGGGWLVSPQGVVDLAAARVHPLRRPAGLGLAVLDDGTVATFDEAGRLLLSPVAGDVRVVDLGRPSQEAGLSRAVAQPGGRVLVHLDLASSEARTVVVDARTSAVTPVAVRVGLDALVAYTVSGRLADSRGTLHDPRSRAAAWSGGTVIRLLETSSAGQLVAVGPGRDGPVSLLRAPEGAPPEWRSLSVVRLSPWTSLEVAGDVVGAARAVDVEEPWWAALAGAGPRAVASRALAFGLLGLLAAGLAAGLARRPRPFTGAGGGLTPRPGPTAPRDPS